MQNKSDVTNQVDLNKPVSFTWPEGLEEAASVLDFLPDKETQMAMLKMMFVYLAT